jgi:hypothetical protein
MSLKRWNYIHPEGENRRYAHDHEMTGLSTPKSLDFVRPMVEKYYDGMVEEDSPEEAQAVKDRWQEFSRKRPDRHNHPDYGAFERFGEGLNPAVYEKLHETNQTIFDLRRMLEDSAFMKKSLAERKGMHPDSATADRYIQMTLQKLGMEDKIPENRQPGQGYDITPDELRQAFDDNPDKMKGTYFRGVLYNTFRNNKTFNEKGSEFYDYLREMTINKAKQEAFNAGKPNYLKDIMDIDPEFEFPEQYQELVARIRQEGGN